MNLHNHFIASVNIGSNKGVILTNDLKEFYKFVMKNPSCKTKEISLDLKQKNIGKKELFNMFYGLSDLKGLRYLDAISTNKDLQMKYRSLFKIRSNEWDAFKRIEDKTL
jgi:hypothetical protein